MYEAFPSDSASASNKLVTESDALIYYQSDSSSITDFDNAVPQTGKGAIQMFYLGSDITNAPTSSGGGFIVVAEQLSTTYISQLATQIGTNNKYTRSKSTNGWGSWQKLVTESDLTSSVTSGSTAPITSGGVYAYQTNINNTTMKSLGFTAGSSVTVASFIEKIISTYGKGFKQIAFQYLISDSANLTDGTNTCRMYGVVVKGLFDNTPYLYSQFEILGGSSTGGLLHKLVTLQDSNPKIEDI